MSKKNTSKPVSSEMRPGPGFRICPSIPRPSRETIDALKEFETPDISDMLNRMYSMHPQIQNMVNEDIIAGTAVTVKVFPGDNLMVHKALDCIEPGDIIVIDASSTTNNAVIGDLVANKAKHRGAAGFIIDGLIRDIPGLEEVNLPIFARGKSPIGPLHRGPGEINYPVSCGGIVVNPGDIVIGDRTGVVVVKREFADEVLVNMKAEKMKTSEYVANVKKGIFSNEWVDELLASSGCEIHEK